jgi:putative DNA primase/helicase
MKASEWAHGKWPEIVGSLIGTEYVDGKHHPCPCGDGKDCFRFSNINGRGNYFCRCSDGDKDGFDLLQCAKSTDFKGAVKLVEEVIGEQPRGIITPSFERSKSYAERLFDEAVKSPRSRYLEGRGLTMPPGLLWHPSVDYWQDGVIVGTYPAMLAPVTRNGQFLTMHVTYLHDGRKAPVEPCRKILPGPGLKGASVSLYPAGPTLGIAEGIETAIAASILHQTPVWAALNTSLLKAWLPPEGVERVIVFGDHDRNHAGQAAAYTLAHKLHGKVTVELRIPDQPGDWNDVLLERE